ncbi:MAG: FtsW/RodA/SpoVE family cell cycle protein, partial [Candidatus Daviesbacteria bacterium]|nr:FtsW/RodA/SpoVE family cell cycle protein [Candidatus Daviesbacteria bacterium]
MKRLKNYPTQTAAVFQQSKKMDLPLLFAVIVISFFGLLMVFDASQVEAFRDVGDSYYFIRQQAIWLTLGFLCLGFFTFFDHQKLKRLASPFFFLAVALLLFVFIPGLGVSVGGAHRWLRLGFITIQPAEIIKFASIIYLAAIFQKKVSTIRFLIITSIPIFIIGILQKDLGSAIIYSLISFGMFFLSGAPIIYFLISLILGALVFTGFIISSPYRLRRVMAFMDPFSDPQGYSYHISQVLIA